MLIARTAIAFVLLLIAGCATEHPQPSDIEGSWEGIGGVFTPYVLLEYGSEESHLVMGGVESQNSEGLFFLIKLSDFVSREKDFTLMATYKDEESGEIQNATISGEVFRSQLLLHFPKDLESDEDKIWLTRPEMFDKSRLAARQFLDLKKDSE